MYDELYDDVIEADSGVAEYLDDSTEDLDEILDFLMDEDFDEDEDDFDDDFDDDYDERRRRRGRRRRSRKRSRKSSGGCCRSLKRQVAGIKTHNKKQDRSIRKNYQLGRTASKVNKVQNVRLGKIDTQMKLDAALEFASSITQTDEGLNINASQLLKGAVKSGMLGTNKGALANPLVIGGLGFILNNPTILNNVLSTNR